MRGMDRPRGARGRGGCKMRWPLLDTRVWWTVDTVVALQWEELQLLLLLSLERSDHESFQGGIGIMGNHGKHSNIAT